jgi:hypothetical protein
VTTQIALSYQIRSYRPFFFLVVETFRWNVFTLVVWVTKKGGIKPGFGIKFAQGIEESVAESYPPLSSRANSLVGRVRQEAREVRYSQPSPA